MKWGNLISAFILQGLGIWIIFDSYRLGIKTLKDPGPGLFPFVLGILLFVLSLPNSVQSLRNIKFEGSATAREGMKISGKNLKLTAAFLLLISYFVLLPALGFIITTFIFLYGLFLMGYPRRWLFVFAISVITVILSYVIFSIFLDTPFPKGFLNIG